VSISIPARLVLALIHDPQGDAITDSRGQVVADSGRGGNVVANMAVRA